ncbi:hypothetical protein Patl1_23817 [Pistacia atlantica]|uniref:Uncharacterized protein n=1 Tax=Pistacia atlantica TaxID=434234 RepID=A0ACC0ZZ78_9ROSI|nr:hypothetical protein Patl1_23817 [Pistacia atlantica]
MSSNAEPRVRIAAVATGGRLTLALSGNSYISWINAVPDWCGVGAMEVRGSLVWVLGYVWSPHPTPCIESSYMKDRSATFSRGSMCSEGPGFRVPGNYVKPIACGGRHSAVITEFLPSHHGWTLALMEMQSDLVADAKFLLLFSLMIIG